MEAETRTILTAAVSGQDFAAAWMEATAEFRGDDLVLAERSAPRDLDLE